MKSQQHEDFFYTYFTEEFMGIEMQFRKNKFTGETMMFFTDKMAQMLFGFDNVGEMMQDEKIQKMMVDFQKETNESLFRSEIDFGNVGSN